MVYVYPHLRHALSDRFVGKYDVSRGHEFFDVVLTEGEPEREPGAVAHDFGWGALVGVLRTRWIPVHEVILPPCSVLGRSSLSKVTIPSKEQHSPAQEALKKCSRSAQQTHRPDTASQVSSV